MNPQAYLWLLTPPQLFKVHVVLSMAKGVFHYNFFLSYSMLNTSTMLFTGIPLRLFESYITRSFEVAWGGEVPTAHQLVTAVPRGSVFGPLLFSTFTTSLGPHHTSTWIILPMLCWWHTALSFISTRWSNFRLPGGHLGMDERTSPTAQPGKDWASCLPCHSNSTAWLHNSVRFINNYPINFSQKSWCNLWWPADLQRAHCKDCSILQVCIAQHQKDQALFTGACCTTSWPGPCHFYAGLLQCSSVWNSSKHNQCFY